MSRRETLRKQSESWFRILSFGYDIFPLGPWTRSLQRKVIFIMRPRPNEAILDVGCGTGAALRMLLRRHHRGKLAGVDLSPQMLRKARRKLGLDADLRLADAASLPFRTENFDIVMSTAAFHHFPEPGKAVQEMARVLKRGGRLYIADLNFYLPLFNWLWERIEPGCVRVYPREEMRRLLAQAGLKGIEQERIGIFIVLTRGEKA